MNSCGIGRLLRGAPIVLWLIASAVQADVTEVTGSASTTVVQYSGTAEIQRDFNRESVPGTTPEPPAIAFGDLVRLSAENGEAAAGQALAVLTAPNLTGAGTPNDACLAVGAFSDDAETSWFVEAVVTERRTIIARPGDLGTEVRLGQQVRVRSRVLVSADLLVRAAEPGIDLTGAEVGLAITVMQRVSEEDVRTLLEGEVVVAGGPDSAIQVQQASGAFASVPLALIDPLALVTGWLQLPFVAIFIPAPILELPELAVGSRVVRVVHLDRLELPYEYEVTAGEPFELELVVTAYATAVPGHTGTAAMMGLPPQEALSFFEQAAEVDAGLHIARSILERDSAASANGQSPAGRADASASPPVLLFPMCGPGVLAATIITLSCCCAMRRPRRRGRLARRWESR